jgi:hypothetical protein
LRNYQLALLASPPGLPEIIATKLILADPQTIEKAATRPAKQAKYGRERCPFPKDLPGACPFGRFNKKEAVRS